MPTVAKKPAIRLPMATVVSAGPDALVTKGQSSGEKYADVIETDFIAKANAIIFAMVTVSSRRPVDVGCVGSAKA